MARIGLVDGAADMIENGGGARGLLARAWVENRYDIEKQAPTILGMVREIAS